MAWWIAVLIIIILVATDGLTEENFGACLVITALVVILAIIGLLMV